MAENKQLLGGLYVQDQYEVDGTPDSVSTICFQLYKYDSLNIIWG